MRKGHVCMLITINRYKKRSCMYVDILSPFIVIDIHTWPFLVSVYCYWHTYVTFSYLCLMLLTYIRDLFLSPFIVIDIHTWPFLISVYCYWHTYVTFSYLHLLLSTHIRDLFLSPFIVINIHTWPFLISVYCYWHTYVTFSYLRLLLLTYIHDLFSSPFKRKGQVGMAITINGDKKRSRMYVDNNKWR
jgi:spore coat protein CotH